MFENCHLDCSGASKKNEVSCEKWWILVEKERLSEENSGFRVLFAPCGRRMWMFSPSAACANARQISLSWLGRPVCHVCARFYYLLTVLVTRIWHLYPIESVAEYSSFLPCCSSTGMLTEFFPRHKLEFSHIVFSYPLLKCLSHNIFSTNHMRLFSVECVWQIFSFPTNWHFSVELNCDFPGPLSCLSFETKALFITRQHPCCIKTSLSW